MWSFRKLNVPRQLWYTPPPGSNTRDFRFKLIGEPNGYGDQVRFSWGLGPDGVDSPIKGTDFAVLKDGRIRSITGFLDQVPGA